MNLYKLSELNELMDLSSRHSELFKMHTLLSIPHGDQSYPVIGLSMGSKHPEAPTFVLIGGVHGLEQIGSQVILAYLESIAQRSVWSRSIQEQLKEIRIIAIPVVNPVGMLLQKRSNKNGVDLMRNAPVESKAAMPFFGGQQVSASLPFYRGAKNAPMEPELQAIQSFIQSEVFSSKNVILVDVHSGFGGMDRIWFPYSHSHEPFPKIAEVSSLIHNFEMGFPNHPYRIEPQSNSYCTHGDFWDYLFEKFQLANIGSKNTFLTLTLEMGSWLWIKKNPLQMQSFLGVFDPIKPHRKKRVLRRHITFLDFLRESVYSHDCWTEMNFEKRIDFKEKAIQRWY